MKSKSFLILVFILISGLPLFAQNSTSFFKTVPLPDNSTPDWARMMYSDNPNVRQVMFEYEKFFESHPYEKTTHTQNYKHWIRKVEDLVDSRGFIRQLTLEEERERLARLEKRTNLKSDGPGTWRQIGPFITYANDDQPDFSVSWQANVYCFDQSESLPDILYAGTEAGGLFKSVNKGLSWQLVTASVPVATISDVKISGTHHDMVFFAANKRIYKTINGGESWDLSFEIGDDAYQLLIHPTNPLVVFCAANNGLYKTTDGGTTWNRMFSGICWDIKFHPVTPETVYLIKDNPTAKRAEFFKSTDVGNTFTIRDAGWYVPSAPASAKDDGAKIAVTPAAPDRVYVVLIGQSKAGDNGWIGLYKSMDGGEIWVNPNLPDGGPYTANRQNPATYKPDGTEFNQGFYDLALAVSHADPDKLWLGTVTFSRSTNGGATWVRIGSYYATQDIGWIHPDIQDMHVRGNEIFLASDGGINYSVDELRTHEARNYGLAGSDYWGFGQGWNEDVLVGGRYHNGNSGYYQTYGTGNTLRLGGAEASTGYVNPMENRKTYFSDISSAWLPESLDGQVTYFQKLGKYPNESYSETSSSEIEWDPRYAGHLYLGESGKIWKSTNGGGYFEALFNFGSGKVLEIEVCRSNPKVIYCVFQPKGGYWDPCVLRRSADGGKTWTALTAVPTNDRFRYEITVNPENENELWVSCNAGYNARKVYRTLDAGKSWLPMNSDLFNSERPLDIQFQGGTDGVVYLATASGAYYYDPADGSWNEFMNGLPADTRVLEMKPFYAGGKLRMATTGRGMWETDLAVPSRPLAQPMTQTDTIYNAFDTVSFESYSIVRNEGARWEWAFSPAPLYVSSLAARNPKVVFGAKGSYDVSLTVTDAENRTSTRTEPAMVTIADQAGADPFAGRAMECTKSGEYASTDNIGIETNTLTITAWVKPDGVQSDYTGIVMNTGTGAGFNFRGGNNTLGYHWPGGSWGWDSKLIVPAGEWSHLAMVATATSMTLYVNGIASRHTASLQRASLKEMLIGSYMSWGDRNFKGQIDEVSIWKRALTQEEIREMQHLVKETEPADPDLIGYYQFNETGGSLFNRAGAGAGSLMGETKKVASSAPVGPGASCRLPVAGSGTWDFTGTGVTLAFPAGGPLYPGETVVTRLGALPTVKPNANPNIGCYWIINGYGSDHFAIASDIKLVPFAGEATDTIIATPSHAALFIRRTGAADNSWEKLCGAASITGGVGGAFRYGSSCGLGTSAQLFLASDNNGIPLLKGTSTGILTQPGGKQSPVRIYPNPVDAGTDIRIDYSDKVYRIRLLSIDGKLVKDIIPENGQAVTIPSAGLDPGTYIIRIKGEKHIHSQIIIVK